MHRSFIAVMSAAALAVCTVANAQSPEAQASDDFQWNLQKQSQDNQQAVEKVNQFLG